MKENSNLTLCIAICIVGLLLLFEPHFMLVGLILFVLEKIHLIDYVSNQVKKNISKTNKRKDKSKELF